MRLSASSPQSPFRLKPSPRPPSSHVLVSPLSRRPGRHPSLKPERLSTGLRCSSRDGPELGNIDSKAVLDAFFLGKAFAETVTERIESTVGEFVSALGRLQAEQRKQLYDLQDEVFERAKKAKERAALEATGEQGLITKPSTSSADDGVSEDLPASSRPRNDNDLLQDMMKD